MGFEGISLTSYDTWKTPLGEIQINQEVNKELTEKFRAKIFDEAFKEEHSIEIQLPIIQSLYDNINIIPVLICKEEPDKIREIIEEYYGKPDFGFIVSSDLSHFLKNEDALKVDAKTAEMLETGDIRGFRFEQACGAVGVCGLVEFANKSGFSLIRINMYNSSLTTGDKSRVVGYGSWMLYEGSKNSFIKKYFSKYTVDICRNVISSQFKNNSLKISFPQVLAESGACFVTLKKQGQLRGCIGSIIAHRPLIQDIISNAQNAAFKDPRFQPLQENELNDIKIDISLLSAPMQIYFEDEIDLYNKIIPDKDGVIIRDGQYQAVYLPSVWKELPDKEDFLKSLKIKAGLSPDYFSPTFEAYKFRAEYIEEEVLD